MGQNFVGSGKQEESCAVFRSLVNATPLQFECVRVLHEGLAHACFNVWREKERSRFRAFRDKKNLKYIYIIIIIEE